MLEVSIMNPPLVICCKVHLGLHIEVSAITSGGPTDTEIYYQ